MNKRTYLSDLTALREFCDSYTLPSSRNRPPLIGVSANLEEEISTVHNDYTNSIIAGGGIPVILPVHTELAVLEEMFSSLDGLLLTGGGRHQPALLSGRAPTRAGKFICFTRSIRSHVT